MRDGLRTKLRQVEGRAAETVARASRGYDAGKNVNGRKRHIVVDTTDEAPPLHRAFALEIHDA